MIYEFLCTVCAHLLLFLQLNGIKRMADDPNPMQIASNILKKGIQQMYHTNTADNWKKTMILVSTM